MKMLALLKKRWYLILAGLILVGLITFGVTQLINTTDVEDEDILSEAEGEDEEDTGDKPRLRFKLAALDQDDLGVGLNSQFKLTLPKGSKLSLEQAKENLVVTPKLDMELSKVEDGFVISPKSYLISDKVYTFKLKIPEENINESWAFQTRRAFKILSSLPANQGTFVPINSGIEIHFSHEGIKDIAPHFTIKPQVEGRFEYHKNIVVFVPKELDYDTVYTVSLSRGIGLEGSSETIQEDYHFSFQTEKSPADTQSKSYFDFYDMLYNFPSDTDPYLEVSTSDDLIGMTIDFNIYRYESDSMFLTDLSKANTKPSWVNIDPKELMPDFSKLGLYASFSGDVTVIEEPYYRTCLMLPEKLPEGHYVITASIGELFEYAYVQINDMQLFASIGDKSSLIWINDMLSGEPVSGAVCELSGFGSVTTGENGAAVFNQSVLTDKESRYLFFTTQRNGHPALISQVFNNGVYLNGEDSARAGKENWTHLFLDRSVYLPTDTVNLWGFARPRGGAAPAQKAQIELIANLYDRATYTSNEVVLESKETVISPIGTYSGGFSFENLPTGGYYIKVKVDNQLIASRYFYINPYVKPQTKLTLESENKVVLSGETLHVGVRCEFFEGTPVAGLSLNYSARNYIDYTSKTGNIILDDQGFGDIALFFEEKTNPIDWQPVYQSIYVNNADPEDTENYSQTYVYEFPRDIMVVAEGKVEEQTAVIKLNTHLIDVSSIRKTGNLYNDSGEYAYKGAAVDRHLKVTLYEKYWDKRETGEHYDMISKKTYKEYEYFEVTNPLQIFEADTVNGALELKVPINGYSDEKYYYITYETLDMQNRPIIDEFYISDWYWYYHYDGYYNEFDLKFNKESNRYIPGEKVEFQLTQNGNPVMKANPETPDKGNVLYMTLQEGLMDYWVSREPNQSLTYEEQFIPNIYVQAVYFDGREIHVSFNSGVYFDYSTKELTIEAKTDKEQYEPGETVTVDFSVKDKNGNPHPAGINLAVVDEAYFALYEQYIETLQDLYASVYDSGVVRSFISYQPYTPYYGGGAEGGEGGDEGGHVRSQFDDTAYFGTVETDSNGKASMTFKLPDNLTMWRLTYQAISDDIQAGHGKMNITSKLPFFLKLVTNDVYFEGDSPVILLKSFGESVSNEDIVAYEVSLEGLDGTTQTFTASGKPHDFTEVSLPSLTEGMHTLTVSASCQGFKDAVAKQIHVTQNLLKAPKVDYFKLSKNLELDTGNEYATLSFYNASLSDYYKTLNNLYWSWGNRLDQVLSRHLAGKLLMEYFEQGYYGTDSEISLAPYQKPDGGMAILPYASSDVLLSAKIASIALDKLDANQIRTYFSDIVNDPATTPLQVSAAYWGLAALREPVLNEVNAFLKHDLTPMEKLYLGLALAELGDYPGAEAIFQETVAQYGTQMEPYLYLNIGSDRDDIMEATALCAMLGLKIDAPEKMKLFQYVENNGTDEILVNLERLLYAKEGLPYCSKKASFTMTIDGKKETVELNGTTPYLTMLSPSQLKDIKFSSIKGDVELALSYKGDVQPSPEEQIADITRTYRVGDSATQVIGRSDMVTVELFIDFKEASPEGYYSVTDVLPSGLRFIYPYEVNIPEWFFGEPEGQLVKAGIYHSGGSGSIKVSYRARVSGPGSYTADSACVKHSESNSLGFSEQTRIDIR